MPFCCFLFFEIESSSSSPRASRSWNGYVICNGGLDEAVKCAMAEAARKHVVIFDRAKVLRKLMSLVEG